MPVVSNVPWVGLKPFSSASVPKMSCPPFLGVAVLTPFGWVPALVDVAVDTQAETPCSVAIQLPGTAAELGKFAFSESEINQVVRQAVAP